MPIGDLDGFGHLRTSIYRWFLLIFPYFFKKKIPIESSGVRGSRICRPRWKPAVALSWGLFGGLWRCWCGETWENHEKTMGKWWENHGISWWNTPRPESQQLSLDRAGAGAGSGLNHDTDSIGTLASFYIYWISCLKYHQQYHVGHFLHFREVLCADRFAGFLCYKVWHVSSSEALRWSVDKQRSCWRSLALCLAEWCQCWILVSSDEAWFIFIQFPARHLLHRERLDRCDFRLPSLDRYGRTWNTQILSQLNKSRSRDAEANGTEVHLSNREASIAGQALGWSWSCGREVSGVDRQTDMILL